MLQCKTKWKKKRLENLSDMQKGKLTEQGLFCKEDWIKLLNTETLFSNVETYASTKNAVISTDKDVLILCDGERSGLVAKGQHGVVGSTFAKLSIDNSEIDSNYLYHFMNNKFTWIQNRRTGTGVPHIPKDLSHILEIEYPKDITEQKKFADILSTCDEVIEKTEETIEKYKQIKAGMMQDLFTRGLDANGKLRPTYAQNPDLYKYSKELDRYIPNEWDVDKLASDNVSIINPACGKLPDEFIYIDLESVINGNIEQTKIISRIGAPSRAQRLVENYDILYQTVRPYQKNNYLYIQTTNMRSVASTGYAQIRTILNPLFLYQYLHTDLFVNKVLCNCTGTSYPAINPTNLGKIYIPIPKDTEQKIIANLFKTIDIKINKENEVLSKYKQIKQGLMKRLLTPPADAEIVEE